MAGFSKIAPRHANHFAEEDAPPPPEVPDKMKRRDFGKWRGSKPFRVIAINFGEDELVDALQAITFSALPHAFQTGAA